MTKQAGLPAGEVGTLPAAAPRDRTKVMAPVGKDKIKIQRDSGPIWPPRTNILQQLNMFATGERDPILCRSREKLEVRPSPVGAGATALEKRNFATRAADQPHQGSIGLCCNHKGLDCSAENPHTRLFAFVGSDFEPACPTGLVLPTFLLWKLEPVAKVAPGCRITLTLIKNNVIKHRI